MSYTELSANRRIIVVDDNKLVHLDFRKILGGEKLKSANLDQAADLLFGSPSKSVTSIVFEIDSAYQGEDGLKLVQRAVDEGNPYTVAFVDVRMPPGSDGVVTAQKILQVDPEIQLVLCTAYSDYSLEDILERFRDCDRLLVLKKPFDVMAATLMAVTLNKKWHLSHQAAATI